MERKKGASLRSGWGPEEETMIKTIFNKRKSKDKQVVSSVPTYLHPFDGESGLYIFDFFHEMLNAERKRAERSGRPFLLMLIHIDGVFDATEKDMAVWQIAGILFSLTRDTDIKGWYKQGSILGVIFTDSDGKTTNLPLQKIKDNLLKVLDPEKISKIEISLHVFPEEQRDEQSASLTDMTLHTDMSKKNETRRTSLIIKRVLDVFGSLVGIVIFSPFFFIIPLLIKCTSKGPIFFRQTRVGHYGNKFTLLKYRSMQVNCDSNVHKEYIKKFIHEKSIYKSDNGNGGDNGNGQGNSKPVYKICGDRRVTPIGNFLRKTSLDELPQFFNVLRGEMSLVGPRPPIPYELENYDVWHRRRVQEVKPGITGLWQVKGRSSTNFDEMVRLDLQYSREWSIWLDLKIIIETPVVMLFGKGGY
jgi:lipopolysaccharide/colanic/teichoic acid biosynthesis glycosyltransferase